MKLQQAAAMRFRGISSAMKVFYNEEKLDRAPAHETCILWNLKIGLHKLSRPKESSSDWCWIIDHVVAQGSVKCLAVMGVRCDVLKARNKWTLSLEDLEPFGLIPMARSNGEEVTKALCEVSHKTGVVPRYFLSDRGSDLSVGVKNFQKILNCSVITLYDVCHKIAREFEKLFENDSDWGEFKEKANYAKKQLHCTADVHFAPPAQRKKARYLNVDIIIEWAFRILHCEKLENKAYDKLKWIFDFREKIIIWHQWVQIGKQVREGVRESGFGSNTEELLFNRLSPLRMSESGHNLACSLTDFVAEESNKLLGDARAPGTTEIIESLFGYFKHVKNGIGDRNGGVGLLILCMASRVGEVTTDVAREALDNVRNRELKQWLDNCYCL
jgi:hypothetical protein